MRILITIFILSPLIAINYWKRRNGYLPDEWYWADELVFKWNTVKYCLAY